MTSALYHSTWQPLLENKGGTWYTLVELMAKLTSSSQRNSVPHWGLVQANTPRQRAPHPAIWGLEHIAGDYLCSTLENQRAQCAWFQETSPAIGSMTYVVHRAKIYVSDRDICWQIRRNALFRQRLPLEQSQRRRMPKKTDRLSRFKSKHFQSQLTIFHRIPLQSKTHEKPS